MSPATGVRPGIPEHLRARQIKASDPALSVWVSANAGSGKTHVLTQRVIRLLLTGVPPARILCLTFTKSAAAQMATRVFETLSTWTMLDDAALRAGIVETGAPNPATADLVRARRLFTRTVETPGGLKIQTIHAFCERLLHLFPFEANVPARFAVADELRTQEMLAAAKRGAIAAAQRAPGPDGAAMGAALALVADEAGAFGLDRLIAEAMPLRAATRRAGAEGAQDRLASRLGGGRYADVAAVRRAMLEDGIAPDAWSGIAAALDEGTAHDKGQAKRLRATIAARAQAPTVAVALDHYLSLFVGGSGPRDRLVTRAVDSANPGLKARLEAERARLLALIDELKIARAVERTRALLLLVDETARRYEHAKTAGGLLDFDDLIERTLQLLRRSDAGWVLHKLDAGIDHVLVDEAQDTSEAQWAILERLTGDFASGAGARGPERSFFVVGDDKQSIFSFQGAAPLMFDAMRVDFERRFRAGGKPFERVRLQTSFRSVPGVLAAVDGVFAPAAHRDGLVQGADEWPGHESMKAGLPGLVELWPRMKAAPLDDPADWRIPVDALAAQDPASRLADRIARKIKALCAPLSTDRVHEGRSRRQRPVAPGDILVLVRTRNAFFEAVIRALKQQRVPVAGADRLDVAHHIAVMDLVAVGRTALLPGDDLSLACVLKSPLFRFDDDDLIVLAARRTGPLHTALAASTDPRHRDAHATLVRWSARAGEATPFAFYVELLGRDRGRHRMEERLGPEAHDAIDEFLRLALVHEQQGAPSLGRFVAEVEGLDRSIKRDMEGQSGAVRVMTVHAAKGLEAKIVFLPDTCSVPASSFDPVVFDVADGPGQPPLVCWSPRKGEDPPVVAAARQAERLATMREYRRLLYVAMTRAEERLYVAGFFQTREPADECWDAMIRTAFAIDPTEGARVQEVPAYWDPGESVLRIVSAGDSEASAPTKPASDQGGMPLPPPWLNAPALDERPAAPPLRPSKLGRGGGGAAEERRTGMLYGSAVHELLEHLPSVPTASREATARAFLSARRSTYPPAMHEAALASALGVLAHPELAALFGPGSRAEVALSGQLRRDDGRLHPFDGKVDRIAFTDDAVIVADFKTGLPQTVVPPAYRDQLALYRKALEPLWPGRAVRAILVWTRGPVVVSFGPVELDAAVQAVLRSA